MGINQGDLLRITDVQDYLDEQVLNIYYYRYVPVGPATNDAYPSILDWFEDNVVAAVIDIQADLLTHTGLQIVNMTNGVDFLERALTTTGTVDTDISQALPSFMATGFKLIRESLVTRNGAKRYAGLPEQYVQGQLVGWGATERDAVIDALKADVVVGLATLLEPIIVSHPVGAPPVASYTYSSIGDAAMRPTVSTQNTRKPST